jgi:outer membrane protein assembly factor BamC
MNRTRNLILLLGPLVFLAGCGLFGWGKSADAQKAVRKQEQPLEVPPDLTSPALDERFAVPDPRASTSFSTYSRDRAAGPASTPGAAAPSPGAAVLPAIAGARIDRVGEQRWIVVKAEPARVWTVVLECWRDAGFEIAREVPEAGIVETEWRESREKVETSGIRGYVSRWLPGMYSTGVRDKFRTRLEKGTEAGTTEIFVSHRGMEEIFVNSQQDSTKWQPRPADRDLEAEMLLRLVVKFAAPEQKPGTTVAAAGTQAAAGKTGPATVDIYRGAVLENAGAGPLTVNDGFDRAWRRVGLALDRVGFTVEDRDRSSGVYFVRYIDPDADQKAPGKEGFLDKLAFWRSSPKSQPQYRIRVSDSGGGMSKVEIQNAQGAPDASATAKRILALLFEQLK